jgi:ankyrin repeat protein
VECATVLLDHGANLSKADTVNQSLPLHIAIRSGKVKIAEYLMQRGASPNEKSRDWFPIHEACSLGHTVRIAFLDVVLILLEIILSILYEIVLCILWQ